MVKTWTVDKQRASVRKAVAKLRSNRKAKGCCPYCGIQKSLGAVDVLHVKEKLPRPAARVSKEVSAGVELGWCRGCRKQFPRSELDLVGKCKACRSH
jgi:hypothetical protein